MNADPERSDDTRPVSLGLGWSAVLEPRARGAMLRVQHPDQAPVMIEIAITASGPVIRAAAAALELESATEIVARCDRFAVVARESASITAGSIVQQAAGPLRMRAAEVDVDATSGGVVVHANDDVKLLGEQVLLNCEREPAPPSWLRETAGAATTLPRQDTVGDPALLPGR